MRNNKTYRIILTGGGTGGHIFPAIAIARELLERLPGVEILFVGANGKMEMEKVPKAGFRIIGLPVSGFHRRLTLKNLAFPFKLIISLLKARKVLLNFRPDLVIGTGGFASGPVLRMAVRRGIPTLLQEQNSWPGVTNRLLAPKVTRICVAYDGMEAFFPPEKIVLTGNPVRSDLVVPETRRAESVSHFGLNPEMPVVLIFGGSQGSRKLNTVIAGNIGLFAEESVQMIWQTGSSFYSEAKGLIRDSGARNISVMEFIYEMNLAYCAADLVVCRSGAITLSELAMAGKPAILVPLPSAAADHQTKNARAYVNGNAAIMITDSAVSAQLTGTLLELIRNNDRLKSMGGNMKKFAKPDATKLIVGEALALCC